MKIQCPISLGELVDKISILMIKEKKISDQQKVALVKEELGQLRSQLGKLELEEIDEHLTGLVEVNQKLWDIEDQIRLKEKAQQFDSEFIELARAVYLTNDQRFECKNRVNQHYGSEIKEVKSYEKY